MKKLLLFIVTFQILSVNAQVGSFAWMAGPTFTNQLGTYGTQGVPSTTNNPGSRALPISWTSLDGRLWMFGGNGHATTGSLGNLNDLWNYNATTSEWEWVTGANVISQVGAYGTKGVASATNTPGARNGSITWKDNAGNLWLFGGQGFGNVATNGNLNDLWKFDVVSKEWTWISGSNIVNQLGIYGTKGVPSTTNTPGARTESISWTDNNGNFWLFGGTGKSSTAFDGLLNDLWSYNTTTNEWTWVSGGNGINVVGTYGTQGVGSVSNIPGTRSGSVSFKDASGDLWLFGGNGWATTASTGNLCDLWKYNIASNQWTWVSGTNALNSLAIYGTKGFPVASNRPSGRIWTRGWVDSSDNFWLYGGSGQAAVAGGGTLNDLWQYNKTTNLWVWVEGANVVNAAPVYGTLGVGSSTNTPGGRYYTTGWVDNTGDFWLFGGKTGSPFKSDLWKINVCNAPASPTASSSQTVCIGSIATLTASGTGNLGWYSSAVGGTYLGGGNLFSSSTLTTNTTFYVQDSTCAFSIRKAVLVTVTQPTINVAGSNTVCLNSSAILTASGALTYTWSTAQNTNTVLVIPTGTTVYTVTGSDAFGCMSSKTKTLTTVAIPSVSIAGSGSVCAGAGIILTASGANSYTWSTGSTAANILVAPSSTFVYTVTGKATSTGCVNTQTALVTVQSPSVTIAGNFALCQNSSSTYTASGANTYSWTSSGISPVYTNTAVLYPNGTVYTLIGKDLQGCTKTQTFVITALTNPSVNISLPSPGCPGQTVTMNASGASTYTWMPGNIVGSSAAVSPSVNTTYTLYGTAANTCTNANTAILTVKTPPSISITASNLVVCSGANVNLFANGTTSNTYTWSTGATTNSTVVSPTATIVYTLTATATDACTNTAVKTISVNALPTLTVTGNNVLCAGNSTTLTASGANTYTWSAGFLVPTIGVTPLSSTNYSVIGKDANNCTNTTTYSVTVNQLPTLNVTSTNTLLCTGETSTLSVTGASTYTWSDNSNGTDLIVTPTANTNYTVTGIDANNCSNSSVFTQSVSTCTGIEEQLTSTSLLVFPNPVKNTLFFSKTVIETSVYDVSGKLLLYKENSNSIDLSELSNGVYIISFKDDKGQKYFKKVIKN